MSMVMRTRARSAGAGVMMVLIAATAQGQEGAAKPDPAPGGMVEAMPHVRVDRERRAIEFDGVVPVDAHIDGAPNLYLEVMVCVPDTREHEALVMSSAKAAHVHAALLLIGLEPGKPGGWVWKDGVSEVVPPTGPEVDVWFVWRDEEGIERVDVASDWIVNANDGSRLTAGMGEGSGWVFAGSRMVSRNGREWYAAEAEGTVVGLHTFGAETIAWRGVMSPSAEIEEPVWIADPARVPPRGTAVVVRVVARASAKDGADPGAPVSDPAGDDRATSEGGG